MSQNEISKLLSTSRNTIRKIKAVTDSIRLSWEDASKMTNEEFVHTIFPKNKNDNEELQPRPDCEMMYKELQKPGVTRTLLWEEYAREVKAYKSQDNLTNLLQLSVLNFFRIKFIFDSIRWTINIK